MSLIVDLLLTNPNNRPCRDSVSHRYIYRSMYSPSPLLDTYSYDCIILCARSGQDLSPCRPQTLPVPDQSPRPGHRPSSRLAANQIMAGSKHLAQTCSNVFLLTQRPIVFKKTLMLIRFITTCTQSVGSASFSRFHLLFSIVYLCDLPKTVVYYSYRGMILCNCLHRGAVLFRTSVKCLEGSYPLRPMRGFWSYRPPAELNADRRPRPQTGYPGSAVSYLTTKWILWLTRGGP